MMKEIWEIIESMEALTKHQKKDIWLLGKFVEVYCAGKHHDAEHFPADLGGRILCPECASFLEYAITKNFSCSLNACMA